MSLVSETRLDMDDHSLRFCRARLQVKALLQQPETGSVITRTPWTVMSALTSSPRSPQPHAEPDRPVPRADGRYAPPNQGNRPGESAQRGYRCAPTRTPTLVETRPRRFTALGTD